MSADKVGYSVSARSKPNFLSMKRWISGRYGSVRNEIDSVFGFIEHIPIYGGRHYCGVEILPSNAVWMYDQGIGLKLPISNLILAKDDYKNPNLKNPIR